MAFFGYGIPPFQSLDEDFDAPDMAADNELCRAIVAGKAGLHPDVWGNYDPRQLRWLLRRRHDLATVTRSGVPLRREAEHRPRPVEEPTPWQPWVTWKLSIDHGPLMDAGEMAITCDDCGKRRVTSISHRGGPLPRHKQEQLWALARKMGWMILPGRDLCPLCADHANLSRHAEMLMAG